VTVPKATVNENGKLARTKDQIGPPGEAGPAKPVTKTLRMQGSSNEQLRLCVLPTNT
jgi:hypothetical protein